MFIKPDHFPDDGTTRKTAGSLTTQNVSLIQPDVSFDKAYHVFNPKGT